MNWFENWFDSPYYHLLYKERDETEARAFIEKCVTFLSLTPPLKVLDLACGKGRHATYLYELGFEVTGVDLSENSILQAKKKENERLHFQVGDMRKNNFPDTFDVIFNLFTSFGYFDSDKENYSVFEVIYQQLKKGGIFVFDYLNPIKSERYLIPYEEKHQEDIVFKITKKIENQQGKVVVKTIHFQEQGKTYEFQERVRLFDLEELQQKIKDCGFEISTTFGSYELTPFDAQNSDRFILIAKKI